MRHQHPKISIISVCLNSEKYILRNIASVNIQKYRNFEHIFIDGKSTDSTISIIKKNARNYKIISQKDEGIYDAMNKGINLSKGEIICFLNSDDYLASDDILGKVAENLLKANSDDIILSCDVELFNSSNNSKFIYKALKSSNSPLNYNQLPHPGLFIKFRSKQDLIFDKNFRVVSDLHQQMNLIFKKKFKVTYGGFVSTKMEVGGESSGTLAKYISNYFESRAIYNNLFNKNGYLYASIRLFKNLFRRINSINTFFN